MKQLVSFFHIPIFVITLSLFSSAAIAENEGLYDLDKAIEVKLTAQSLKEITEVIDLCESALKKGLDESNTKFANQLLSASLHTRASGSARMMQTLNPRDPQSLQKAAAVQKASRI